MVLYNVIGVNFYQNFFYTGHLEKMGSHRDPDGDNSVPSKRMRIRISQHQLYLIFEQKFAKTVGRVKKSCATVHSIQQFDWIFSRNTIMQSK